MVILDVNFELWRQLSGRKYYVLDFFVLVCFCIEKFCFSCGITMLILFCYRREPAFGL